MSTLQRVANWCADQSIEVYGWLGFVLAAGLVGGIGASCLLSALWLVLLVARSGLTWFGLWALPAVVLALLSLWLLSILLRLKGAPWRSMLLAALLVGGALLGWLDQPFKGW